MSINLSVITDALVDSGYEYNAKEDLYAKAVADGSIDEVTVDQQENTVTAIRYNRNGVQTSYKEVTVRSNSNIQQALNII